MKGYSISTEIFLGGVLAELSCLIDKFDFILALYGKGDISIFLKDYLKAFTLWNLWELTTAFWVKLNYF